MTAVSTTRAVAEGTPPPRGRRSTGIARRPRRGKLTPYLLMSPALLAIAALIGFPAVLVLVISFQKLDLGELVTGRTVWVGFDNFKTVLSDPSFWSDAVRTVAFTAGCVGSTMVIGLFIALLLTKLGKAVRIFLQVALVLAWAMPILAATTVFQWMFDSHYGILNKTLVKLGLTSFANHDWFSTGASTLIIIGILIVWQATPFVAFTVYAGLVSIPTETYEACALDGANAWQTFRSVSWPGIAPIVALTMFLQLLWDFKVFSQVWAIKQGGPNGGSTTLPVLQYLDGIANNHFGTAAAVSVLMIAIIVVITVVYVRMLLRSQEVDL
ncbi:MAG TPA: sugar ABC transporter permease [Pseudonocardiaceae bacterium]|jgi:N,N'-diacetylchitobiose transport system permease protein|nr:sugar ABC transporter permease [Pseudonocardiaceae bacterium]